MRALSRLLPIAVLLCCYGIFGLGSAAASALPIGQCTTISGVVVAVDFSHWGGPIVRGCGSTPTTGYQLVNQGGFATTGTKHDGPGFVCRIGYSGFNGGNGEPADQACLTTPPASASWSYWNANPGQSGWTLSPSGAANTNPPGGAVQAWTFGSASPSFSPDSVRAHNSTPAGGATGSRSSGGSAPSRSAGKPAPISRPAGHPVTTGATASGVGSATGGQHTSRPATGAPATGSPAPSAATGASGTVGMLLLSRPSAPTSSPNVIDAEPTPVPHPKSSGSFLPELAGGAIVLALAALAGYTAWQRKQVG